jgi:hypothetical protein
MLSHNSSDVSHPTCAACCTATEHQFPRRYLNKNWVSPQSRALRLVIGGGGRNFGGFGGTISCQQAGHFGVNSPTHIRHIRTNYNLRFFQFNLTTSFNCVFDHNLTIMQPSRDSRATTSCSECQRRKQRVRRTPHKMLCVELRLTTS